MPTSGLDHVNILTDDLEATAAFYAGALELEHRESPGARAGKGAWMCDASGRAIVHVVVRGSLGDYGAGHEVGLPTNAVHHVAFACTGFAEAKARMERLGLDARVNDGIMGLRQIMLVDPNGINVEMNFADG